ncbi:hypothetical protein [Amycolatopsis sp. CA-128772]|uniref:hypothetical protein n=1 Tax=Amycolatopsis sp. CA-128772 TaxID=2073159 RepID=UPI000CD1F4B3|nr:hypothetical protein [Amycolatopsis sp. CA-128772]
MVTLDRLVNVLGGYGVRRCCCPVSRDVPVRDVVVRDPGESRELRGDVYLAVGAESVGAAVALAAAARA